MVLSKRKRDGEFVPWTSAHQTSLPETAAGPHDVKKPKITSESQYMTTLKETSISKELPSTTEIAKASITQPTEKTSRAGPTLPASGISSRRKTDSPYGSQETSASVSYAASIPISPPGPSQNTPSSSTSSKRSRGKKAADDAGPVEKRAAKFKSKCPQNIKERLDRVRVQRMYMVDRRRNGNELREEFNVLGSTGNVYTVTIDNVPRCDCPDATKGNHCKHILFVFTKVLHISKESGFWYQKALLTSELEQIFAQAPLAPNSEAYPHVREAYARATGRIPANANANSKAPGKNKRVPGPDDDCPICYDGMHGVAEVSLTYCEQCGNAVHKECFQQWQGTSQRSGKDLTCVWCRAKWAVSCATGSAGVVRTMYNDGYINLSNITGQSHVRDTSTYYHGPRRGRRYYGYQSYDGF